MWTDLGIEPTKDAKEIRRAYAMQLRAIDPDADPAAFQRLRAAYERALMHASRAEQAAARTVAKQRVVVSGNEEEYHKDGGMPDAEQASAPPVPRGPTPEERERAQLQADIGAAMQAGDTKAALEHLVGGLARGWLGLGERDYALEQVMPAIIQDKNLSAQTYLSLLELSGWEPVTGAKEYASKNRRAAWARGAAEKWYVSLENSAQRYNPVFMSDPDLPKMGWSLRVRDSMIARYLLDGSFYLPFTPFGFRALRHRMNFYTTHSIWIEHRFDPRNIRRASRILSVSSRMRIPMLASFTIFSALATVICFFGIMANPMMIFGATFFGRVTYSLFRGIEKAQT